MLFHHKVDETGFNDCDTSIALSPGNGGGCGGEALLLTVMGTLDVKGT